MSFIEESTRLRICLFRYVFCRNLANLVIFVHFLPYCCQQWSPEAIFTANSSFTFFCLSRTGDVQFGSILLNFRSKNLKASLMSSTRALFSDKARCFSQSGHALYGNFIIIYLSIYHTSE